MTPVSVSASTHTGCGTCLSSLHVEMSSAYRAALSRLRWERGFAGAAAVTVLCLTMCASAQPVVINEIMADNESTIVDPDYGARSDWIELFNPGTSAVDLEGYFLTDDMADPLKWRIGNGVGISAGGYVLLWADDGAEGYHTNFKLSADGETVGLFDAVGNAIDVLSFGAQAPDISFGRSPDGSPDLRFLGQPSPGSANGATGYLGVTEPAEFSVSAGFYTAAFSVELSSTLPESVIRYTTDGAEPTSESAPFEGPIPVASTTVLRAAVFREGYLPGAVATSTYLIGEERSLPVVSLSTNPANLFGDETGIYVAGTNGIPGYCRSIPLNWNQDWERPVHVEFFEPDGTPGFSIDAGVKIHGGCTRIYPQKSLAIYARRQYGAARIDYPIFETTGLTSYNNLVLRSSAQDWWRTMFRDGMIQTVIDHGMRLETQAYRPAVVFINGAYWGIHNLREKQNEHYLADHFGIDPDDVEILEGNKADVLGQSPHYDEMMAFMLSTDMSRPEVLDTINTWMDVDAFVDYLVAEIYAANADWPGNNLKFWRPTTPGGRWRWMIFDMDFGFGGNALGLYTSNTLALATDPSGNEWPNPPWSTLLIRTLLENPAFRNEFIQRFAVHMNTTFAPERVLHTIDSLQAAIADEIPRHKERWPQSMSYASSWEPLVEIMRVFARNRPLYVRPQFYEHFELSGSALLSLVVDPPGGGTIFAHEVAMPAPEFDAVFFKDVPVKLRAVPTPGHRFIGWEGASAATTDTTSLWLTGNALIKAIFVEDGTGTSVESELPRHDRLYQNYPNPFSSRTRLEFDVARSGPVSIRVYDVLGRLVETLLDQRLPEGRHATTFDGEMLPAGVYFSVMVTPRGRFTGRLLVVR